MRFIARQQFEGAANHFHRGSSLESTKE